ncbi:MAG: DUF167 domain-containing protein [Nitrospirota bacterium]
MMLNLVEDNEGVILPVRIQPRASKDEIVGEYNGALKIKLTSPPVEGEANRRCIEFLSKRFKIAKSQLEIIKGEKSKDKLIKIIGLGKADVVEILQDLLGVDSR